MHSRKDFGEAVSWVMRYLAQLNPSERATQRGYDAWASSQTRPAYSSSFQRNHGGWVKVRDAAQVKLKTGR
jgi:hypothetical protein